ncbi:MAG: hypothetical protein KDA37_07480 [Planctomycetales bacterium]|nr:hypothetical protein [Planctomycetales bacterium]
MPYDNTHARLDDARLKLMSERDIAEWALRNQQPRPVCGGICPCGSGSLVDQCCLRKHTEERLR